ncbi:MAG: flavin-binding protein [Proteobacteria bacterium]|nr:flavin-binding protein [Pseudomonadota bacterium]
MSAGPELEAVLGWLWAHLGEAAARAEHGFRFPVVAVGGEEVSAATVTLRALWFFADARGGRIALIRRAPRIAWAFYGGALGVQLRASGPSTVHCRDARARALWEQTPLSSRRAYLAPAAPGTPSPGPTSGLPGPVEGRVPSEEEARPGFANFAVVETRVERLDWLALDRAGNRRARFLWTGEGFSGEWLTP